MLIGEVFRELIITGPGASLVAEMETIADAGEVVVSPSSAELITDGGGRVGSAKGAGFLLRTAPDLAPFPPRPRPPTDLDLSIAMPRQLTEHLLAGDVVHEHRSVAVCFVEFSGTDAMRAAAGMPAVTAAVDRVVSACQRAADAQDVTFLSSDIYPDGGKVILVAGAPRNTGDDAARVLSAARQILDSDQELEVRAGVNVGRAFAGDYGPPYRRVYSLTGDCVNLAARLMAAAGHGELIASRAALEASRTKFETRPLKPFAVKGKTDLIEASSVGPTLSAATPAGAGSLPLVGRNLELELLLEAWQSAADGIGRAVELVGDPGVGKSRLLQELVRRSGADSTLWLDGNIYATHVPYQPFHRLFVERLGIDPQDPTATDRFVDLVGRARPDLLQWAPLIGIVAGIDVPETELVSALDPAARKTRMEQVTSALLGTLLPEPTLLVFNDTDFMDQTTTDLLDVLITDAVDRPWLIVPSHRPAGLWTLPDLPQCSRIDLAPLTAEAADQLLSSALTSTTLSDQRMSALVERSGGNPLFLTALAAGLDTSLDAEDVPDTIEGVIGARIDRLPPQTRTLVRTASVLGAVVDVDLLTTLVDRSGDLPPLREAAGIEEFLDSNGRGELVFSHNLARETAYGGLPFRRRQRLHGLVTDILVERNDHRVDQSGLLSLHSYRAGRYAESMVYSTRAAELARDQYAGAEAAECYRRAIDSARRMIKSERDERQLGLLWEALANVHEGLGDIDAMNQSLHQGRPLLTDPVDRARMALLSAVARRQAGDYAGSLRWATTGLRAIDGLDGPDALILRARLSERYARNRLAQGRLKEALQWADRAEQAARISGDQEALIASIQARAAAVSMLGRPVDLSELQSALAMYGNEISLRVGRAHNVLGVLAFNQGEWSLALQHYRLAADTHLQLGRPLDVALQQANAAEVLIFQGHLDEAKELLEDSMRRWRGATTLSERAFGQGQRGRIAMARADYISAMSDFEEARAVQLEVGDHYEVVLLDALIAECAYRAGDVGQALSRLDAVTEHNRKVDAPIDYLQRVRGLALVEIGDFEHGVVTIRAALESARARGRAVRRVALPAGPGRGRRRDRHGARCPGRPATATGRTGRRPTKPGLAGRLSGPTHAD